VTTEHYSDADLERFKDLQRIAYDCAQEVARGLEGATEREATVRLTAALRERGAEAFFHTPFAWFGDRTGFYRFRTRNPVERILFARQFFPTERRLERGMPAILDTGLIRDGLCADIGYTFALGGNPALDRAMACLREIRVEVLRLVRAERTMREIYEAVDTIAAASGYENAHRSYPAGVLGHKVGRIPLPGRRATNLAGFDLRTMLYLGRQLATAIPQLGRTPLWNHSRLAAVRPEPGLWSIEPHLRKDGLGAKWEEILVVTDSDARWLDDDLPHVRTLAAA
jgi:Xaa-Pro aminopeptidase